MDEISLKELLANWKYAWAKRQQGKEKELGRYTKLSYSLEELETAIKKELPKGNVLQAYAEINREWGEKFGNSLYEEILYFYKLCEGNAYFDIAEVEEVLCVKYECTWNKKTFIQKCMDIIIKAPIKIQDKNNLYEIQYQLFRLGKEEEVWDMYQNKEFFPREILGKLYNRLQEKQCSKSRIAWIATWLSSSCQENIS